MQFTITKIDKAEAETNIHVRDAMLAENEVQKIEGTYVESDEEEEVVEEDGTVTVKKVTILLTSVLSLWD